VETWEEPVSRDKEVQAWLRTSLGRSFVSG
jgi:hypothetical protein